MPVATAIHVGNFSWGGGPGNLAPVIRDLGAAAEEAGVGYVSFMDHWFQIPPIGPATEPMLEGYTALAFLAAHTSTVRLQLLCTGVTYRHPGLLAKTVTTLDVLSGGRAALGIGAAWFEREHLGLGVPFPPVAERFERLEETVQICLQMWGPDNGPYAGKHYSLAETLCVPAPLSQPRPPVMIAGGGERKTLRLVARYADACNLMGPVEQIAAKLDVLRGHCDAEGRDYSTITVTAMAHANPFDDVAGFLGTAAELAKLGVTVIDVIPRGNPAEFTRRMGAEVVPALLEL